jgi:hypothetical protein
VLFAYVAGMMVRRAGCEASSEHGVPQRSLPANSAALAQAAAVRATPRVCMRVNACVCVHVQVYISIRELLPTALRYDPDDSCATACAFWGMAIMASSLLLFKAKE